jgi:Ferritin-like
MAVRDLATALNAIDTIVEQGEGTPQSPLDLQNGIARFYRYQQLAKGMQVEVHPSPHFDPTELVTVDDDVDVIRVADDPLLATIDPADANVRALADQCDRNFSEIVDALHAGFSGDPDQLSSVDLAMTDFGASINGLLELPLTAGPLAGFHAGPRFLYVPAPRP